jgi:DNA-directed RNA polymerase specialized sigma24 family protein
MYTINNFLDIKKEIYEYCLNLTITTNNGIKVKHKDRADDLFQEVYLKSYKDLPKIKKQIKEKSNYIQIIKNITFWIHASRYNKKLAINKIIGNLNYYQDSVISEYLLQNYLQEKPLVFKNILTHPDFNFFTRNLNDLEIKVIKLTIEGYTKTEIIKKYNITYNKFYLVFEKLSLSTVEKSKLIKVERKPINNLEFLEFKIGKSKLKQLKLKERHIIIYSMYLQGYDQYYIANLVNKSRSQVGLEIFRIKNKLKSVG